MKPKTLKKLGIPKGKILKETARAVMEARTEGISKHDIIRVIQQLIENPEPLKQDKIFGNSARMMIIRNAPSESVSLRNEPVPFNRWGTNIEVDTIQQMTNACLLPVSVTGALMPDAHLGYGLPIGGVLAVNNAVIPYAVGMDIACRMKLSVLDVPLTTLSEKKELFRYAIETGTCFGVGSSFKTPLQHPVMDEDWSFSGLISSLKNKAWKQLGTSGGGNHFVEFGELELATSHLGISPGTYTALLSHSGSRGCGADIAEYYSRIARKLRTGLPRFLSKLAWLDLDSDPGIEYWQSMELMGKYASANHELIHRSITECLGSGVLAVVENHHNYAWKEIHSDAEVVVHRKGATPAGINDTGVIPGTMGSPGFVVRGLGNPESLNSAAHGAGRCLSRKAAKKKYSHDDLRHIMKQKKVDLISAGLDEIPMAYKDINDVMAAQNDLVTVIARFKPRIVKMAN